MGFPAPLQGSNDTLDPKVDTTPTPVPQLLMRRQNPAAKTSGVAKRIPFYTFALGLAMGVGLSSPLTGQLAELMAGLIHAPDGLAAIVDPIGIGKRHILVLGSDVVGGNTDVMFTVQIDGDTTRITQVPRDTLIETPELGVVKANALYGVAGSDVAKAEVSRLLSVPVKRHFKVNLDAVAKLADALGGVNVDVPKRMYYVDNAQGLYIDLYPGPQLLKGEELEGFLRYRNDELGDLGRLDRQKLVLREVFRKLSSPATLAQLPALLKIAGEDVQTDLSPIELTQLASAMSKTQLSTTRLPGSLYWYNDLSYWLPRGNQKHGPGADQPAIAEGEPSILSYDEQHRSTDQPRRQEEVPYQAYQDQGPYLEEAPYIETEATSPDRIDPGESAEQPGDAAI